jgi:hypothetical protein
MGDSCGVFLFARENRATPQAKVDLTVNAWHRCASLAVLHQRERACTQSKYDWGDTEKAVPQSGQHSGAKTAANDADTMSEAWPAFDCWCTLIASTI